MCARARLFRGGCLYVCVTVCGLSCVYVRICMYAYIPVSDKYVCLFLDFYVDAWGKFSSRCRVDIPVLSRLPSFTHKALPLARVELW